jgi:rRNA maturation endonuclease Nob1
LEKNSDMGFKKGINKCVACEKKMKENPDETGMCSKCGAAETRIEKTLYKELIDEGRFP